MDHIPQPKVSAENSVKDQIILAADQHFRLYGYEKTSVSDIAKSIGISKAYVYKFFKSKQAIAEVICSSCLRNIEIEVEKVVALNLSATETLEGALAAIARSSLRLFFQEQKLYDIAAFAAAENWQSAIDYKANMLAFITSIINTGIESGESSKQVEIEDSTEVIFLILRPYYDPQLLQYNMDKAESDVSQISKVILKFLS